MLTIVFKKKKNREREKNFTETVCMTGAGGGRISWNTTKSVQKE